MPVLDLVLLLLAAVCFAAAAFGVTARVNLLAAGLLCWVLVPLLAAVQAVA